MELERQMTVDPAIESDGDGSAMIIVGHGPGGTTVQNCTMVNFDKTTVNRYLMSFCFVAGVVIGCLIVPVYAKLYMMVFP